MGPPADTGLQHSPSNFSISWPLRLAICLVLATGSGKALFPPPLAFGFGQQPSPAPFLMSLTKNMVESLSPKTPAIWA